MVYRRVVLSFALSLGAISAFSQDSKYMSREQTMHRSVQASTELRVFTYATWNTGCGSEALPTIEILTRPAHGKAELRPGQSTVRFVRSGEPDCTGKTFPGLSVWYVPDAGFRGTDKFDAKIIGTSKFSHDTYIIDVK